MKELVKIICILGLLMNSFMLFSQTNKYDANKQYHRIGYTTNYSNGNYNSTVYKSFNSSLNTKHYGYNNQTLFGNGNPSSIGNIGRNIRRSAQRPFSGNFLEDLADWWRMMTDSDWPGYVDDDYWEEFIALYPEYEEEARNWFESQGLGFPADPDDPFLDPIGDFPLLALISFLFIYIITKKKRGTC